MKNKTFTHGPDCSMNACVGENSGADNEYGYSLGFSQAVEVMIAAAKEQSYFDPDTGEPKGVFMDVLIYPICFCARHHIELFIKRQIAIVSSLRGEADGKLEGHDIGELWLSLKAYCAADRRLPPLADVMEEVIDDFASIDQTGQTFRYHTDLSKKQHLNDVPRINIALLSERFKRLSNSIEEFELMTEYLRREYAQGNTTPELSREDIRLLAKSLPPRSLWGTPLFGEVKQQFMADKKLSGRAFCRAVKIIESHREFSSLIGVELPLSELKPDVFSRLLQIKQADDLNSISREEWASMSAVCEVGRVDVFSEVYNWLPQYIMSDDYPDYFSPADTMRDVLSRNNRFGIGLQKLGQTTLLEIFNNLFPPQPK